MKQQHRWPLPLKKMVFDLPVFLETNGMGLFLKLINNFSQKHQAAPQNTGESAPLHVYFFWCILTCREI
jgi:hypothetical protein